MPTLLDLPREALQMILRYAIPSVVKYRAKRLRRYPSSPYSLEIADSCELMNPRLPVMLVCKNMMAEVAMLPESHIVIRFKEFEDAWAFAAYERSALSSPHFRNFSHRSPRKRPLQDQNPGYV